MRQLSAFWHKFRQEKMAIFGLGLIALVVVMALAAPFYPFGPMDQTNAMLAGPSAQHWLGTDNLGRDIFGRILWGSRVSFLFGFVVAGLSLVVGVLLGAISGYYGGWLDDLLSRFVEIFMMIPSLFLIILIVALFGSNLPFIMLVAGLTLWPSNAKITRAQVLTYKKELYVDAARAAGGNDLDLLAGHILPNCLYPVVANATLQMASAIMLEASLSFLGLGDPNVVSWGQVLKSGQNYITSAPWICISAGAAIFVLVFAFNLVGDGINYALNPRLHVRVKRVEPTIAADPAMALDLERGHATP